MSWSYDPEKLQTQPLYQVRYIIGDVDREEPLLQDEEIQFSLDQEGGNTSAAAVKCCSAIVFRLAKQADISATDYSVRASQRCQTYNTLLKNLQANKIGLSAFSIATPKKEIFDIDMMGGC